MTKPTGLPVGLAGLVETNKQSSTEADEHQTPKPNGMVDKTTTDNRHVDSIEKYLVSNDKKD